MAFVNKLYRGETRINFIGHRRRWYLASGVLILICLLSFIFRGFNEGVEFKGGSQFQLTKLEPASFGGEKGFRFEYALTRKVDGVTLSGIGYSTVSKGELFALVYQAPRLTFFSRHKDRVEQIARSARVKT